MLMMADDDATGRLRAGARGQGHHRPVTDSPPRRSIRPTDRPAARQANEDVLVLDALEAVVRPPRLTRSPAHRAVSRVTRAGSRGPGHAGRGTSPPRCSMRPTDWPDAPAY